MIFGLSIAFGPDSRWVCHIRRKRIGRSVRSMLRTPYGYSLRLLGLNARSVCLLSDHSVELV